MAKRQKKVLYSIGREEAEEAFAAYAKADARASQLTSKMDVEITRIREKYQDELSKLSEVKEENFDKMQSYAVNNRDEFGKRKSLDFTHGILGFRTGTPSLKTKKGYTWASSLNLIKEFAPNFIRVKEEPNKELLLAEREELQATGLYEKIGVYVDQKETFFVEPKKEVLEKV